MTGILIGIHTIISILLIAVILMQAGQGGGLAGGLSAGMGNSIFGGRGAATAIFHIPGKHMEGMFQAEGILYANFQYDYVEVLVCKELTKLYL